MLRAVKYAQVKCFLDLLQYSEHDYSRVLLADQVVGKGLLDGRQGERHGKMSLFPNDLPVKIPLSYSFLQQGWFTPSAAEMGTAGPGDAVRQTCTESTLWPHLLDMCPTYLAFTSMGDIFCLFQEDGSNVHTSQACIFRMLKCRKMRCGQGTHQLALRIKPGRGSCRNVPELMGRKKKEQGSLKQINKQNFHGTSRKRNGPQDYRRYAIPEI